MKTTKPDFNKIPKIKKVGGKIYHLRTAVVTKYLEDKNSEMYKLYSKKPYNKDFYKRDKTKIKGITLIYTDYFEKGQYQDALKRIESTLKHLENMKLLEMESKKLNKGLKPLPF